MALVCVLTYNRIVMIKTESAKGAELTSHMLATKIVMVEYSLSN